MEKTEKHKKRFGLVGKDISYSFSRGYFSKKFEDLGMTDHSYENFDLANINEFVDLVAENELSGLNVTIPYKEQVIPYLDRLDETAEKIGAVNTIKFTPTGLVGYNTDAFGFQNSIEKYLDPHHQKALILGTGGASKAIAYVFGKLNIDFRFVSRNPVENQFSYQELDKNLISEHLVIVNSTPLGTYPNIMDRPAMPYEQLSDRHLLFDLIYNPKKTKFLALGEKEGAKIQNGSSMLEYQAEEAWSVWNS